MIYHINRQFANLSSHRLNIQVYEETRRRTEVEVSHQAQLDLLKQRGQLKEDEVKKLADLNAELFGHVNTKQKIKHVAQLKAENVKLKQVGFYFSGQYSSRSSERFLPMNRKHLLWGNGAKTTSVN